jgi:hypothetical protein
MHNPADDPAIINPFLTANIGRQMRLNSSPLLVIKPKQIPAHHPNPPSKTNQDRMESGSPCLRTKINGF